MMRVVVALQCFQHSRSSGVRSLATLLFVNANRTISRSILMRPRSPGDVLSASGPELERLSRLFAGFRGQDEPRSPMAARRHRNQNVK